MYRRLTGDITDEIYDSMDPFCTLWRRPILDKLVEYRELADNLSVTAYGPEGRLVLKQPFGGGHPKTNFRRTGAFIEKTVTVDVGIVLSAVRQALPPVRHGKQPVFVPGDRTRR